MVWNKEEMGTMIDSWSFTYEGFLSYFEELIADIRR